MISDKIILGIDPGTTIMGYGLIHITNNQPRLLHFGTLLLHKYDDHGTKLKLIFERTLHLIDTYTPDEMAAEAPFFGKNVQSMLKLGRAQGVALAAALYRNLPVFEYSPRKIKQSITGKGAASKEQVALMLQRLLKIDTSEMPAQLDATDGLAAAMCHFYQHKPGMPVVEKAGKMSGWKGFVAQNPGRVK
jgi:crossover junction endodeoxyribonuclease RuvC